MKTFPGSPGARIIRTAVDWSGAGVTLADYLAGRFTYRDRAAWCERIVSGEITLDGATVPPETTLRLHQIIEYHPGDLPEPPADLSYQVLHADALTLVVVKSGNLCIHPAGPFFRHTLWHLLRSEYGEVHFINRLDRETSGLVLAARTSEAARRLAGRDQLRDKVYQAIVHGEFPDALDARGFLRPEGGVIRKKRRYTPDRPEHPPFESAGTRFRCLRRGDGFSLVRAELETGRMHQIRATLSALGFPVAGDKLYGLDDRFYLKQRSGELTAADRERLIFSRQALHAAELTYRDPATGETRHFTAPLPPKLAEFAHKLERVSENG